MATLVLVDVLLHVAGFARFHRAIREWKAWSRRHVEPADTARICEAVDAAAAFYFKHAWCLQRSAVQACLMRTRGLPARLVIGVRRMPFMAHAWVELDGRVVNDDPRVRRFYEVIEQC
jgi:hypothetical protein